MAAGAKAKIGATIPCVLTRGMTKLVEEYAEALKKAAPTIGGHGLTEDEFWRSGLFRSAIERLRGIQAASTKEKYDYVRWALARLEEAGLISSFEYTGAGDRHDFHVTMPGGKISVFEAKGCLDGNNSTIFHRPANAEEFLIWSLCQNQGSDLRKGVWSGVHVRLGGKIIAENVRVEALIVWDMMCSSVGRNCPKLAEGRGVDIEGRMVPPPCVYLFPRTVPDPRNNPAPPVFKLHEVELASALLARFGGDERDVTEVHIEARMNGANVERKTKLVRLDSGVSESGWTQLRRAVR